MPGPQTCSWEYDGDKWVQQSGPQGCPAPDDTRGEPKPGDTTTSVCPPGVGGAG